MANTKSAEKRSRQALKRRDANRDHMSAMRTAVKRLRKAVADGDHKTAAELLPKTIGAVDSTAQKRVIHKNTASRTKSRLTKAVAALKS